MKTKLFNSTNRSAPTPAVTSGSTFIILAAVLWALDGVIRRSLYSLSPMTIVFYEHLAGSILLAPFFIPLLQKEVISAKSYGWAALVALLSGLLGTLWFTTALIRVNFISFSVVFLLQKLQPIFATTAAVILLKEKITANYAKWAALALVAAFFVTFPGGKVNLSTGAQTVSAALFALGAAFAWGSSTAFSKKLLALQSNTVATGLRFYLTSVFAAVALLIFQPANPFPELETSQLVRFFFIALSTGMVALVIYYRGLRMVQAKVATILELVFPVLAILIDATLYGSVLSFSQYAAAGLLLFAVYNTSKSN